ncbi:hypothetical protein ABIB82_007531 [Bradyrhizobium sp. i1.8.4]|uniref:hypothetical protein n=1 Tax=unclassified Bradyrhizobium TaxID=2631580 RepID=UPI003D21C573
MIKAFSALAIAGTHRDGGHVSPERGTEHQAPHAGTVRGDKVETYLGRGNDDLLALLWQIYWIDRRNRIPESGFQ